MRQTYLGGKTSEKKSDTKNEEKTEAVKDEEKREYKNMAKPKRNLVLIS